MEDLLGLTKNQLSWQETSLRAIIVFMLAIFFVRISGRRSFDLKSPLDVVVSIILGTVMGRTIGGGGVAFFPSLVAALVVALTHRGLAMATLYIDPLNFLVKGRSLQLIKNGKILEKNLISCNMRESELIETLRLKANTTDLSEVQEAFYESSGDISVVIRKKV